MAFFNRDIFATQGLTRPTFTFPQSATLTNAQKSTITGIKLEDDFAGATIGKDIPVFIGGTIIAAFKLGEGPFLTTIGDEGFVDWISTPFAVAVPGATRTISSLRLNGTESLTSDDGGATFDSLGAVFDDVVVNWLPGNETQTPFASSISRYGASAVPYRSHFCVELKVVPLAPFSNLVPLLSAKIHQEASLTRREALARVLRYARFDDSEFEAEVSGEDIFWVCVGKATVFEFLQHLQTVFRNWNIVATDKLRIFENSSTVTPIELTIDDVKADTIKFWTDPPETVPADRALGFVDTGRDNNFNTVTAVRARYPIPLTASQNSQSIDIPIGMSATQAETLVNKSLLIDEFARDKCSFKAMPHQRGLEPGDIVDLSFDQAVGWSIGRILTVARNALDWTLDVIVERIELSLLANGPSITSNGGGATASITINEGATAVTTVTADQSGTFSIVGGDDSLFFSIHPTTGVLTITARDYEDPQDADGSNTYEVIVQVLADGLTGTQIITVTIADIPDGGGPPNSIYLIIL